MPKTLALIHTSATLVPVFQELIDRYLKDKDLKIFNIVDDSLIKNTIERGEVTPDTSRRVVNYVGSAEEAGADYIMVTCSSIGDAVESSVPLTKVPVLRVDQPMVDKAVQSGKRIGVIATLPTTLAPTSDLVRRRAIALGKDVDITSNLCEGAFEALMGGHPEVHDTMVATALKELAESVDVILLAQASMARVVGQLSKADKKVPILASPEIAMEYLAQLL
ncbi:aspartate/glutamate racemase family protein [Aestuariibaculum lutulentum]|uniref:Aspartate/glutamate racemase family protein n=1 Tax=Aestuariibaculum lutulentum TaxID=2920935 RepID=A0ABS9RKM3_9FLAO|nr:aspartate/glutamate racemase family protein [Aestuariibaculum lutulentum]MCH4553498.1 aspartate/glutamate racemase family protein [Aestuariibaculum lutulentum]